MPTFGVQTRHRATPSRFESETLLIAIGEAVR
jgi:hypothetical protein